MTLCVRICIYNTWRGIMLRASFATGIHRDIVSCYFAPSFMPIKPQHRTTTFMTQMVKYCSIFTIHNNNILCLLSHHVNMGKDIWNIWHCKRPHTRGEAEQSEILIKCTSLSLLSVSGEVCIESNQGERKLSQYHHHPSKATRDANKAQCDAFGVYWESLTFVQCKFFLSSEWRKSSL